MTEYTLKHSDKARSMRLSVLADGAVVVTVPKYFGQSSIESIDRFIAKYSEWIDTKVQKMKGRTVIRVPRSDIARLKREALAYAQARCAHYAARYGLTYKKISIRAQKTRWGSCSKTGNLSFNYKIMALPEAVREAIIVHEICHLGVFDHSKKFWDLVSREVPDHKALRAQLRKTAFIFY